MNRLRAMIMRASPKSFSSQVQALLGRPDAAAVLPSIRVPLLFLSGSEDGWSPLSQHHAMRAAARHGRVVDVAGAGHMAPIEQPAAVAEALRTWLTDAKDSDPQ
jgi:pimeloyl-ACP methyl ester carboxylesterase